MAGVLVGMDIAEALAGMPPALDQDQLRPLLRAAEAPFLAAWQEHNKESDGNGER